MKGLKQPVRDIGSLFRISLLGAVSGLLAAFFVLAFRWTVETTQVLFLPDGGLGNYEALARPWRLILPTLGGLLVGLWFDRLPRAARSVGIVHVVERLRALKEGRLPLRNALVQFVGGTLSIAAGQSVDREGPGVHLGAASGGYVARRFAVGREDDLTLTACGAAAAIAAAFNTPLAGVVFVIEVLEIRYSAARYMPVILAAVTGAVISRIFFGPQPAFEVPELSLASLLELPYLAVLGVATGLLGAAFVGLCETTARHTLSWPSWRAFALAGLCTGVLAQWTPQIMGISYDTLDAMLHGHIPLDLVLGILGAKLVATAVSVGLRVPGGLIGPSLVVGGAAGAGWGILAIIWFPSEAGSPAFYAVVGMVAMMSAVLNAPLAALTALLELTANPNIILPGMVVVFFADLVARGMLGKDSAFATLLRVKQGK